MQLIGLLDSPYVRRVAICLRLLEIEFDHRAISVFRDIDAFRSINPVVKAPTLICDDGTALMDSSLILDYIVRLPGCPRQLLPEALVERQLALQRCGLALVACEKSVQLVYEQTLRPVDKQHQPWIDRVAEQLEAAYRELELALRTHPPLAPASVSIDLAGVTAAVAWDFTQQLLPGRIAPQNHPALAAFSDAAEALPAFPSTPSH